ncbi:hypothetical protein KUTeg_003467 [Tegillarca granosa]|uniref:Disease resistance R13L4/SHOC-2-like LRR domain-containing protein n=1 Tax=Tegillarca granosa TaxID=220873 RepID=A0ABQ9FNU6_TEGGR|nr:hypothetical protein KUTeg_003467 [Tegillarca granosa]
MKMGLQIDQHEVSIENEDISGVDFSSKDLCQIPPDILHKSSLTKLILSADENELEKLPQTLGLLCKLEVLELADNVIKDVPIGLGQLKNLKTLNLSNNKLKEIPDSFGELPHLEYIDLSGNDMENLPSYCKSADTLKKFIMERNHLASIPDWVCMLTQVSELSFSDNQLHHQPFLEKFGKNCKKLKVLDLGGNFMTKLPDSIGELFNLEKIHLGSVIDELERRAFQNGNWLTSIPDTFCNLVNIKEVHLDENLISELPSEFGNLVNLEFLDLGQNVLHEIPESFGNLRSLKICQLSKNKIQLLPSTFGNLTNLEDLRLDNNLLEELPESFCKLTNLKTLDLFYNRLTEIPSALICFSKLVRLDLDDNNFKIPKNEVPQIIKKTKYPARDPKLKDNWRGRPRQDIGMTEEDITVSHMADVDPDEEEDNETPESDKYYNEDLYRLACIRNMSIWRSHGGPSKRQRFVRNPTHTGHQVPDNESSSHTESDTDDDSYRTSDDENEDDEFEPPIFGAKMPGEQVDEDENTDVKKDKLVLGSSLIQPEENWDDEIEEVEQYTPYENFNDIYQHPEPKTLADAGYIVDSHLFLPYDIHEVPVTKQEIHFTSEPGQFDDISDSDS